MMPERNEGDYKVFIILQHVRKSIIVGKTYGNQGLKQKVIGMDFTLSACDICFVIRTTYSDATANDNEGKGSS